MHSALGPAVIVLSVAFAAAGCRYGTLRPTGPPRPAADRLFEDCDRQGLSHADCQIQMGCTPRMTREACKESLKRRLDLMSHD